ncbi:group II intron reverse transcriptase/maturase [Clostridium sp.]|uniref:group II intron reverse transcriptase/maturase n=1 Tax=Clostridium sp. TaxID=1506 RepID=UPI0039914A35
MEESLILDKRQILRNSEYYGIQHIYDKLYKESCENKKFTNLMQYINSKQNILLAFRNIKSNKGSLTVGTDNLNITYFKNMNVNTFVDRIQNMFNNYYPKGVRRVEIPKPNGKTRPLGIPCIEDRIIQQCIKQVLEPICEAKFHKHSYGFRPNRATSHAIARSMFLMNNANLHYVVDIDIKGFFDNVNHSKLKKQLWTLGIQDKSLLSIIGKILKSEIQGVGIPQRGTPQGGIISPILANVVLNELDWWISSQWETFNTKHIYTYWNKYKAMKCTKLKEVWLVRYADDAKFFCRDYKTAQKMFKSIKMWLNERLGLDISQEKSKVTNLRRNYTEFLGFKLMVKPKKKRYVCRSRMCNKAVQTTIKKLKEQIKRIQRNGIPEEVNRLNSMILGGHNYYNCATHISLDYKHINFLVTKSLDTRLRGIITNKVKFSETYKRLYGSYNGKIRTIHEVTIFPIYGCKTKPPMNFKQDICDYTEEGRKTIHHNLKSMSAYLTQHYLQLGQYGRNVELFDNSISLIAGQGGLCGISRKQLEIGHMECHHKVPKFMGGTDEYKNLIWLNYEAHKLVHAREENIINKYLNMLNLDEKGLKRLNVLRRLVGNSVI